MTEDKEIRKTVEMAIKLDPDCEINRKRQLKERVWLYNKIKEYIEEGVQSSKNINQSGVGESSDGW